MACLFSGSSLYISQASGIQIGNNNTMHFRSVDTSSLSSQSSTSSSVSVKYKELLEKYGEFLSHTNIRHFFYIYILFYFTVFYLNSTFDEEAALQKNEYRIIHTWLLFQFFDCCGPNPVQTNIHHNNVPVNQSMNQDFRIILLISAQKRLILLHLFFFFF